MSNASAGDFPHVSRPASPRYRLTGEKTDSARRKKVPHAHPVNRCKLVKVSALRGQPSGFFAVSASSTAAFAPLVITKSRPSKSTRCVPMLSRLVATPTLLALAALPPRRPAVAPPSLIASRTRAPFPCLSEASSSSSWRVEEDWALMDSVKAFTVGEGTNSATFWDALAVNSVVLADRTPSECAALGRLPCRRGRPVWISRRPGLSPCESKDLALTDARRYVVVTPNSCLRSCARFVSCSRVCAVLGRDFESTSQGWSPHHETA